MSQLKSIQSGCYGYCKKCKSQHQLGSGKTRIISHKLMAKLQKSGSLQDSQTGPDQEELTSTNSLFGPARGKMFGVMECEKPDGSNTIIKAFSGQFNGSWSIEGWCPPLFDIQAFDILTTDIEKQIKKLGREIAECLPQTTEWLLRKKQRRGLSQQLMRDIHNLYQLHNFQGETAGLASIIGPNRGIPTGTGDCCGPKMLNFAAKNNLRPLGMSEFYWGRENRSGSRNHGSFYPVCDDKCQPILGFMLCGL